MAADFHLNEDGIYISQQIGKISYPDIFTDICFEVEDSNFWFINRNTIIANVIRLFPISGTFVDIGSGNGYQVMSLKKDFPNVTFFLLEPNYNGCKNARIRKLTNIYNCTALDFDYKSANATAVGLFDVIEHIEDDISFLSSLSDLLPKDSYIYVTVPSYQAFWNDMDDITGHYRRYTKASLKALGNKAGLQLVYSSYFFSYLTIPYLIFRILPYRLGKKVSEDEVIKSELGAHRFSKIALALFWPFHILEKTLISLGLSLPFGNSCIAVFKK